MTNREIIAQLQNLLHEHNELVRLFKIALNRMIYRMMIRQDADNRCYRRLFQQYSVDMYFKVETERPNFVRFN